MLRLVLVLCIATLSGCATKLETVYVPAENSGWKVGYGANKPGVTLIEYIPSNESIENWSRIFTIQFLENMRNSTSATVKELRSIMFSNCPNTKWDVLVEGKPYQ